MVFQARELLIRQRTQAINALREHLSEFGQVVPQGAANASKLIAIVNDPESGLPAEAKATLQVLIGTLAQLEAKVAQTSIEQDSRNAVAIPNNQAEQRTQMASGVMKTKGQDAASSGEASGRTGKPSNGDDDKLIRGLQPPYLFVYTYFPYELEPVPEIFLEAPALTLQAFSQSDIKYVVCFCRPLPFTGTYRYSSFIRIIICKLASGVVFRATMRFIEKFHQVIPLSFQSDIMSKISIAENSRLVGFVLVFSSLAPSTLSLTGHFFGLPLVETVCIWINCHHETPLA